MKARTWGGIKVNISLASIVQIFGHCTHVMETRSSSEDNASDFMTNDLAKWNSLTIWWHLVIVSAAIFSDLWPFAGNNSQQHRQHDSMLCVYFNAMSQSTFANWERPSKHSWCISHYYNNFCCWCRALPPVW